MEEYKKVTISFTKDQLEKMDEIMSKEQGYSRSSLVREAVDYYLGYLAQKGSVSYLSPIISQNIKLVLSRFEENLSEMLFKLAELEAMITFAKSSELEQATLKDGFDEKDYKDIHRQLFEPLYAWAGEYRAIDISKKGTAFANHDEIPVLLTNCFKRLKAVNYFIDLPFDDFIEEIVDIYCTTNYIHLFREWNGRTQRVFLSQLIRYNGYEIHFSKIDTDFLMLATIHAAHGVIDYLHEIFREHIEPVSK